MTPSDPSDSSMAGATQDGAQLSHHEVIVVGAGFAGIGCAIALRGIGADFLLLEKASEIGGVWRDNTYPDCGCDVPSALYSYSFAPNPRWSRLFAKQDEIKTYTHDTARKFGVLEHLRVGTELLQASWNPVDKHWRLRTNAGNFSAQFLVLACGPMHVPTIPRIPGMETFPGVSFHSSRWDHACDLRGKRVAVIGSGASAIQFVPEIASQVTRLTLFQRTAPWVLPKLDVAIARHWQTLFAKLPAVQSVFRKVLYLQFELLNSSLKYPALVRRIQGVGLKNIRKGIRDASLRKRVTPDFSLGCKRILMSNRWYPALAQAHVDVLPGVAEIAGNRVVASDGSHCEADAIIFATGFEVADPPIAQSIVGQSGQTLASQWKGSPAAYLGTMSQDCPNLFLTFGPNLYTFSSAFVILEAQIQFIRAAVLAARKKKLATIAVDPARAASYNQALQAALQHTVWNSGCSSYFIDKNGRNSTNWPWTTFYMRWRLRRFKAADYLTEQQA